MISKFDKGISLFIHEEYSNAMEVLKEAYIQGDKRAMEYIIKCAMRGGGEEELKFFLLWNAKDDYGALIHYIRLCDNTYCSLYKFLLDRANSIVPGSVSQEIGYYHYNYGEYREAIKYFKEAVSMGKSDSLYSLGKSYRKLEMYPEAIEAFKSGIVLGQFKCWGELAKVYTLTGRSFIWK